MKKNLGNIGLFSAGGMGLWHGVEYYETEKLTGSNYFKDWPQVIKRRLNLKNLIPFLFNRYKKILLFS